MWITLMYVIMSLDLVASTHLWIMLWKQTLSPTLSPAMWLSVPHSRPNTADVWSLLWKTAQRVEILYSHPSNNNPFPLLCYQHIPQPIIIFFRQLSNLILSNYSCIPRLSRGSIIYRYYRHCKNLLITFDPGPVGAELWFRIACHCLCTQQTTLQLEASQYNMYIKQPPKGVLGVFHRL